MNEAIAKAAQTADLLRSDVRDAHRKANAVESIVLLTLLADAAALLNRISALADAIESERPCNAN